MWNIRCGLIILSVFISVVAGNIPGCDYSDTVSLKGREPFQNGSYSYNNILIPSDKIGNYEIRETLYGKENNVASYPRGCLCQVKSCVLFCCEPDKSIQNFALNITLNNGQAVQLKDINEFAMQIKFEISCDLLEDNDYNKEILGQWTLFENGTLYNLTEESVRGKNEYCLLPLKVSDANYELVPYYFKEPNETKTIFDFHSGLRVISVLVLVITIALHMYLPEFQTIYCKSCLWYFICLTISFLCLWIESLIRDILPSRKYCFMIGYGGYYAVMAMFLWLTVINFHLWKTIKTYGINKNVTMFKYHAFVWTTASVLLVITASFEYKFFGNSEETLWRPGISQYYCWINTQNDSAIIFYYAPMIAVICINSIFTIITTLHFFMESRKNNNEWNTSESQKNTSNRANYATFLRIFSIAGIIWALELFAYFTEEKYTTISFILDLFTSSMGITLFFTVTWKKEVIKSIYERLYAKRKCPSNRPKAGICLENTTDNTSEPLTSS